MEYASAGIDRRQFLVAASASAVTLKWHEALATASRPQQDSPRSEAKSQHRIRALRLHTAAPLKDMKRFYEETLGLPVERNSERELTVQAGRSPLTFVSSDVPESTPWYHVAFDIPENKLFPAREWLLERTPLKQRTPGPATHPEFRDVAQFTDWNAHSVFFWDPAGNLLEYIARHTLKNNRSGPFTPDDVLYPSEIGLMADDMKSAATTVSDALKLPDYMGVNDHFHPLGDHHGLVIVFPTGRQWRMPDNTTRPTKAYPTVVDLAGNGPESFAVPNYPYSFRMNRTDDS